MSLNKFSQISFILTEKVRHNSIHTRPHTRARARTHTHTHTLLYVYIGHAESEKGKPVVISSMSVNILSASVITNPLILSDYDCCQRRHGPSIKVSLGNNHLLHGSSHRKSAFLSLMAQFYDMLKLLYPLIPSLKMI